jgi:chondroitin-sulfate-ABC endolyase/exolyase
MQKTLTFFIVFLLILNTTVKAQLFSFEDNVVPTGWSVSTSPALSVSGTKYKLGTKSLSWTWPVGSKMTVANPTGLDAASINSSGGIYLWVYNTTPNTGKLVFSFLNSLDQVKCSINFNLNFTGWRCLLASFTADMKHDKSLLSKMTIQTPSTTGGTLYFDHIEFQTGVRWDRMTDAQHTITQSDAAVDFWGIRSYGNFPATIPVATQVQKNGIDTVLRRLDEWYLSTGKFASNTYYKYRKSAIDSDISSTNSYNKLKANFKTTSTTTVGTTVTGEGLYPENITSANGVTLKNFRDVAEGPMLWLAYDYRMNAGRTDSKTRWLNLTDWFYDQGWADGSSMGGLFGDKLRSSGYFNSLILMRNELDATRRTRELTTLNWFSLWGNTNMPFDIPGDNADHIRSLCIAKLAYVALQPDSSKRVLAMTNLKNYFNNAFSIAHGFLDTFKPDFSGYHHAGTYLTAYYPDALYAASLMYYLLHDTPYALSDSVYSTLKNCLLTWRLTASEYDVPAATCGRFPTGTEYVEQIMPAFAYLALSRSQPDTELLAAFGRLWKPTVSPLIDQLKSAGVGISHRTTLGETELCLEAINLKVAAEANPKKSFFLPFSGLLVNRGNAGLVTIKGFSKYIWDYESGLPSDNLYGRYLSYGQIEYTSWTSKRRNNNYTSADWDWSRIPGTTTKYLSKTALTFTSSVLHRNFSDRTFLGGAGLNDTTAVFGMQLHDNAFDKTFYANKSVFCLGNVLVCLGSNIANSDKTNKTETTLFQQEVKTGETVKLNGTTVTATTSGAATPVVRDNIGNRFIVKTGTVDIVKTNAIYAAVINHGVSPSNVSYRYFQLLQSNDTQEANYLNVNTCPIEVARQDNVAHIVRQKDDKVHGYVIFNAASVLNDVWINKVNMPSLVMFKENADNRFQLVVSEPDMHRTSATNLSGLTKDIEKEMGLTANYEITLNGLFQLDGDHAGITLTNSGATTKIALIVRDGKSYPVNLKALASGVDTLFTENAFNFFNSGLKNIFIVNATDGGAFQVQLYTVDGKVIRQEQAVLSPYALNLTTAKSGIYMVRLTNSAVSKSFKFIVQ